MGVILPPPFLESEYEPDVVVGGSQFQISGFEISKGG
jgi:hypothetical protein